MPQNRLITRRRALQFGLGAAASAGLSAKAYGSYLSSQVQTRNSLEDSIANSSSSLKQKAAAKGLIYGSSGRYKDLMEDQKFAACFVQECGMLVPEWELKWSAGEQPLRPSPAVFDFTRGDRLARFAQTNQLLLRGHSLVWHLSLPDWFAQTVDSQNAEDFLTSHIRTVVGHYAGQMHSWDVVNEAIELADGQPGGLRNTPWLKLLGSNYINLAFRAAAAADPDALLVYNDYGLEYGHASDDAKRSAVLKLLEGLKTQGTPVHALGIQSHLSGDAGDFDANKLRHFLADVADLGLKVLITELDVTDQRLPSDIATRDRIVAEAYENYLLVVLDQPAVMAVITWGLSDRYTWLSEFTPRSDGASVRSLPLNANFDRKPAWYAVARAFEEASRH